MSSSSPTRVPLRLLCELLVVSDARAAARLRSHCLRLVAARFDELAAPALAARAAPATEGATGKCGEEREGGGTGGENGENGGEEDDTLTLAELVRYARPEFDAEGDLVAEHLAAARPRARGLVVAAGEAAGEGVGTLAQDLRESYLEGRGLASSSPSVSPSNSDDVAAARGRDALAREFDGKLRALLAFAAGGEKGG